MGASIEVAINMGFLLVNMMEERTIVIVSHKDI